MFRPGRYACRVQKSYVGWPGLCLAAFSVPRSWANARVTRLRFHSRDAIWKTASIAR